MVQRGNLKKGETLLITGAAGGMGVIAITLGKLLGATVIAAVSNADKAKLCSDLGADFTINYSTQDLKKIVDSITQGKGVDVCYEVVGGEIFDKVNKKKLLKLFEVHTKIGIKKFQEHFFFAQFEQLRLLYKSTN